MKNKRPGLCTHLFSLLTVVSISSTVFAASSPPDVNLGEAVANDESTAVSSSRDIYSDTAVALDTVFTSGKQASDAFPVTEDSNELLDSIPKSTSNSFDSSGNSPSIIQPNTGSGSGSVSDLSTLLVSSEGTVNDGQPLSIVPDSSPGPKDAQNLALLDNSDVPLIFNFHFGGSGEMNYGPNLLEKVFPSKSPLRFDPQKKPQCKPRNLPHGGPFKMFAFCCQTAAAGIKGPNSALRTRIQYRRRDCTICRPESNESTYTGG